ncbi:MAG TPA: hypothetical protein DDY70_04990, partial [Clostridiales bacterium]|nr:hypothetical protein [Clostridiales bacterium]
MIFILSLKLLSENGEVKARAYGEEIDDTFTREFEPGDHFRLETDGAKFVKLALAPTLAPSIVYLPDGVFEFAIPSARERAACYAPGTFDGDSHRVRAWELSDAEIYGEREISLNSHDR